MGTGENHDETALAKRFLDLNLFDENIELEYFSNKITFRKPGVRSEADDLFHDGLVRSDGCGFQDLPEAARCFAEAAALGHAEAPYHLGMLFLTGEGVEKNYQNAAFCFYVAAQRGVVVAQFNLGLMYYDGLGVERDEAMAAEYWAKAAKQGCAEAWDNLRELQEQQSK